MVKTIQISSISVRKQTTITPQMQTHAAHEKNSQINSYEIALDLHKNQ